MSRGLETCIDSVKMPKYFCDYCDVYLTHDSMSVRKAHNSGRNHIRNVVDYYQQIGHEQAQIAIDSITQDADGKPMGMMPLGFPGQAPGAGVPPFPFPPNLPGMPAGMPLGMPGFPPGMALPPGMPLPPFMQQGGQAGSPGGMPPFMPPPGPNGMPFPPPGGPQGFPNIPPGGPSGSPGPGLNGPPAHFAPPGMPSAMPGGPSPGPHGPGMGGPPSHDPRLNRG